jgi:hypothetical protein
MSANIHQDLMPLYVVGGVGVVIGVFYLLNKNVDKLTKTLSENETVQVLSDPVKTIDKAVYQTGFSFWDWYDRTFTEPAILASRAAEAQKQAESEYAKTWKEKDIGEYAGNYDPAIYSLGIRSLSGVDNQLFNL